MCLLYALWTYVVFYFLKLKSISNPSYSLTFKVSISAARKKWPQPEEKSLYLLGCTPFIVAVVETALDRYYFGVSSCTQSRMASHANISEIFVVMVEAKRFIHAN